MQGDIVQYHAAVLHAKAKPVVRADIQSKKVRAVIAAMKKALAPEENGVAIAAPQIGEPLRIFIVAGKVFEDGEKVPETVSPQRRSATGSAAARSDEGTASRAQDMVFINPEFVRLSRKKSKVSEGCLSVRGVYGTVLRHDKATVKALSEQGESFTYHGSGLLAQIFQHEIDHLDGILFIDKVEAITEGSDLLSHER